MPKQTREELDEYLREQVDFLRVCCARYDAWAFHEAKRVAHTIRVLVHDTRQSDALLEQLDVLNLMPFLDSAGEVDLYNQLPLSNLTIMAISLAGSGYVPSFDENRQKGEPRPEGFEFKERFEKEAGREFMVPGIARPFVHWWDMPVTRDNERNYFSRKDLVLPVSNKDGGSHVDPQVKDSYARLSRSNSLGWVFGPEGDERPLGSPVPASVRQIGYELELSLIRQFPALQQ